MKPNPRRNSLSTHLTAVALSALGFLALSACNDSNSNGAPPSVKIPLPTEKTPTTLTKDASAPGIVLDIVSVSGASGPGGSFAIGDTVAITFSVKKASGTLWRLDDFTAGRILLSGPTFNYQRVIPERDDLLTASTYNADGTFTYRFPSPIPGIYAAPLNDSPSIGSADGELTGTALLDGTYTVGMYVYWNFTVDSVAYRDAGNATKDFVLGASATLEPRELVKQESCNQCHQSLRAHGSIQRNVRLCVLCHTSGAEDKNVSSVEGGTPEASIDFRVMVHKIHNAAHLPSVLGVQTKADGTRDYAAAAKPYKLVGFANSVHDFSEFNFPVMPSAYVSYLYDRTGTVYTGTGGNGPMPRDVGYAGLPLGQKLLEDKMRTGVVSCEKCHGDPDGAGPLVKPAQGDLYKSHPTRRACGSCHDDVNWNLPYTANLSTMPPQPDDSKCMECHEVRGSLLDVENAHTHPYSNPKFNPGVNIDISAVSGGTGSGGKHKAGDPILVTLAARDDAGSNLAVNSLVRFQMIVTGPTTNPQWIVPNANAFDSATRKSTPFTGSGTASTPAIAAGAVTQTIAVVFQSSTSFDILGSTTTAVTGNAIGATQNSTAEVNYNGVRFTITQGATAFAAGDRFYFEAFGPAPSYTLAVPRDITLEYLGTATGADQTLPVANTPLWWGRQVVFERTALVGVAGTLTAPANLMGRYVATDSAVLPNVAVGDRLVIDAGTAAEEYVQVGRIQKTDDFTGADLGTADRYWFTQALRFRHLAGATVQEATLSSRREGIDYTLAAKSATSISLLTGRFTSGNPVVVNYRSDCRFGWYPAPGLALETLYLPAAADTDDIDATWGDWKALPIVDGTYTVGMWVNRDFTVTPQMTPTTTGNQTNLNTDTTTYRMISPPAGKAFLFGAATAIQERKIISAGESCNACHGDLQAHGNGRRGFETCLHCHTTPGLEDGPLYTFDGWYVPATPGVTMDFRTLLHKAHMGKELSNASSYIVNGVYLGVPYPVDYAEVGFPATPGGVANCTLCHGATNTAWLQPSNRTHPAGTALPARTWRDSCGSCHDSGAATSHIAAQTSSAGMEACEICHGQNKEWSVRSSHRVR